MNHGSAAVHRKQLGRHQFTRHPFECRAESQRKLRSPLSYVICAHRRLPKSHVHAQGTVVYTLLRAFLRMQVSFAEMQLAPNHAEPLAKHLGLAVTGLRGIVAKEDTETVAVGILEVGLDLRWAVQRAFIQSL